MIKLVLAVSIACILSGCADRGIEKIKRSAEPGDIAQTTASASWSVRSQVSAAK